MLTVRGATLAAVAAAARLARLGHEVTLATGGVPLGQRWAPREEPNGDHYDALSPIITLPAAWRDLFKKTGAHLVTALNGAGLELVPAPATIHRLPDGTDFALPAERGAQRRAVSARFGQPEADRWHRMIDELDRYWAAFRCHALEAQVPITTAAQRRGLGLTRTVGDLAAELTSPLSVIPLDLGHVDAPALTALTLSVERTFGRWQLVNSAGRPRRASILIDLLDERLASLGVRVIADDSRASDLDCLPRMPRRAPWRSGLAANPRPAITREMLPSDGIQGAREIVDHVAKTRTWLTPRAGGLLATTVTTDGGPPDPAWGLALRTPRDWLRRPPIVDGERLTASACSPAGPEPWAELSSAALAVYELHERVTGGDARPTNRNFRLPRRFTSERVGP